MNKDLEAARRLKYSTSIIYIVFFTLTIILIPIFSFLFDNYWLLFGIVFSFLGTIVKNAKIGKVFLLITIAIIIYWIEAGFDFSDQVTFYWFSFLFGSTCQTFVNSNNDLADRIIDMKSSEITSEIISSIKLRQKFMHKNIDEDKENKCS